MDLNVIYGACIDALQKSRERSTIDIYSIILQIYYYKTTIGDTIV